VKKAFKPNSRLSRGDLATVSAGYPSECSEVLLAKIEERPSADIMRIPSVDARMPPALAGKAAGQPFEVKYEPMHVPNGGCRSMLR